MLTLVFVDTCKLSLFFVKALQTEFLAQCKAYLCLQTTHLTCLHKHMLQSGNAVSPTLPSLSHPLQQHVSDLCRLDGPKPFNTRNLTSGLGHFLANQLGLRLMDQNACIWLGAVETVQLSCSADFVFWGWTQQVRQAHFMGWIWPLVYQLVPPSAPSLGHIQFLIYAALLCPLKIGCMCTGRAPHFALPERSQGENCRDRALLIPDLGRTRLT